MRTPLPQTLLILLALLCSGFSDAEPFEKRALGFFERAAQESLCVEQASALNAWLDSNAASLDAEVASLIRVVNAAKDADALDPFLQWREGFFSRVAAARTRDIGACADLDADVGAALTRFDDLAITPLIEAVAETQATHLAVSPSSARPANLPLARVSLDALLYFLRAYHAQIHALSNDCIALSTSLDRWFDGHMTSIDPPSRDLASEYGHMTPEQVAEYLPLLAPLLDASSNAAPLKTCVLSLSNQALSLREQASLAGYEDTRDSLNAQADDVEAARDSLQRVQGRMEDWIIAPVLDAKPQPQP